MGKDAAGKRSRTRQHRRLLRCGLGALAFVVLALSGPGPWMAARPGGAGPIGAALAAAPARVAIGEVAPDVAFATVNGGRHKLSQFRGRPVMLWFFASWCPSCVAGTRAVVEKFERLRQSELRIIQLRLFDNLGYSGPSAGKFAKRYASGTFPSPAWLWGEASRDASVTYDPLGFPDVYFLIDGKGVIRAIDTAPNVTIDKILAFAAAQGGAGGPGKGK